MSRAVVALVVCGICISIFSLYYIFRSDSDSKFVLAIELNQKYQYI